MDRSKVKEICDLKERLMCVVKSGLDKGAENIDAHEMGEVVDMIKDLAEAEKLCYEAEYYCSVTKAMEEYGEEHDDGYGYNPNRYASGRYAPTGHGNYTNRGGHGYYPMEMMEDWTDGMDGRESRAMMRHATDASHRMGYTMPGSNQTRSTSGSNRMSSSGRMTQSGSGYSPRYHTDGPEGAMMAVDELREMSKNADPETKERLKEQIRSLMNEIM